MLVMTVARCSPDARSGACDSTGEHATRFTRGVRLSGEEQRVCAAIAEAEGELVELLQTLVRFDTTTH